MSKCIKCGCELIFDGINKNTSIEHIIPNAIGGKLKSSKLLCKKCNSDYGRECDYELCKQLMFFTVMLNPNRDRKSSLILKTDKEEEYDISLGGKPILKAPKIIKEQNEKYIKYKITSRNIQETTKILKNLKKKYPQLDIDSIKSNLQKSIKFINKPLKVSTRVKNTLIFQAIYKIALEYYIENGGQISSTTLFNEKVCYSYELDFIFDKYIKNTIYHGIFIKGDPKEKYLIGYVELYSTYSFLILLDDNYNGDKIQYYYCFDLFNNNKLDNLSINYEINLKKIYDYNKKNPVPQNITYKINKAIKLISNYQFRNIIYKIFDECYPDIDAFLLRIRPYILNIMKDTE